MPCIIAVPPTMTMFSANGRRASIGLYEPKTKRSFNKACAIIIVSIHFHIVHISNRIAHFCNYQFFLVVNL